MTETAAAHDGPSTLAAARRAISTAYALGSNDAYVAVARAKRVQDELDTVTAQLEAVLALLIERRDMARRDYEQASNACARGLIDENAPELVEHHEHWRTLREFANLAHRTAGRPIPAP